MREICGSRIADPDFEYRLRVMRDPVTGQAVTAIMEIALEIVADTDITEEFGGQDTSFRRHGHRRRPQGDATWILRLGANEKVRQITWQAGPFNVSIRLADAFRSGLAGRRGDSKPALVAAGRPRARALAATVDRLTPLLVPCEASARNRSRYPALERPRQALRTQTTLVLAPVDDDTEAAWRQAYFVPDAAPAAAKDDGPKGAVTTAATAEPMPAVPSRARVRRPGCRQRLLPGARGCEKG
jgi:hypothetical protein